MKKVLCIIFSIMLLLISCTNEDDVDSEKVENKEITIAIWEEDYDLVDLRTPIIKHIYTYNRNNDVGVRFDIIKGNNYEEFLEKLNTKLYLDEGPTLIYIDYMPYLYELFKERGIAEKVDNNSIPNINKVYDFYLEDEIYFIPIGAQYLCISFNKEQIEKLNMPYPDYNWTIEDYYKIRSRWIEDTQPIEFSRDDVEDIIICKLDNMDILTKDTKKININTRPMKEIIYNMRKEIHSGKYILTNGFTYEDYYNACVDYKSKDRFKHESFVTKGNTRYYLTYTAYNGLKTANMKKGMMDARIHFPNVKKPKYNVRLGGFIVNSNGKNKELGYKFLNSLLREEFQMQMYRGDNGDYVVPSNMYTPVIKTVEDDIEKVESKQDLEPEIIELKNYIYDKMEKGEIRPEIYKKDKTLKTVTLRKRLYKNLFKFIFTEEEYGDEELSGELQKLEDRYNLYLNE